MSPILDLQRRLHEVGRIRIGRQVPITSGRNAGAKRPERLDHFRLTSASKRALDAVAQLHGGTVTKWQDAPVGEQWELLTDATELRVIVPPDEMSFSQSYELWSAGGCQRRCDGTTETISDGPCLCDAEARECKPHTRLSVMLVGIAGVGLWRIDTQGWYAAAELQGAVGLAQLLGQSLGRSILPGRLRVEARTVKRPDPRDASKVVTRNFVVPVLDFDVDVAAVALAGLPTTTGTAAALPAPAQNGVTPVPALPAPSLAEQLAAAEHPEPPARRRNSPPALPPTGMTPRPAPETEQHAEPPQQAQETAAQRSPEPDAAPTAPASGSDQSPGMRRLHVLFGKTGISNRAERLTVASMVIGRKVASSKDLTDAELESVCSTLEDHVSGRAHIFQRADGGYVIQRPEGAKTELPA